MEPTTRLVLFFIFAAILWGGSMGLLMWSLGMFDEG